MEKTSDESMSAILFQTTPKGGLPHYSYIFRNPYPLGEEVNNVACSRLGNMLYLDIQKGEEAIKTAGFQQQIGGTAFFMKRLIRSTKGCA